MPPEQKTIPWDLWLTIAFYLLAGSSIVAYLALRADSPKLFVYLGCGAIVLRIIYYIKRYFL